MIELVETRVRNGHRVTNGRGNVPLAFQQRSDDRIAMFARHDPFLAGEIRRLAAR